MTSKFSENCPFVKVSRFTRHCSNVYVLFTANVKYLSNTVYLNNSKYFGISLRTGHVNRRRGHIELKETLTVN